MWAEKLVPSGIAALIVATVPLWMNLLEGLRPGGQRGTLRTWLGVGLGLLGVACVARPEGDVGARALLPALGLSVASFSWSLGSLYARVLPRRLPLFSASAIEMLAGSAALFLQSWLFGESPAQLWSATPRAWGGLVYLASFGSLIGFTAFAYCLNELPASTVGTYAYVNPVVAVVLGALVLDEPLSPAVLLGGVLILAAVLVTTLGVRRSGEGSKTA
jgi:drug/metabolite transporter (DMT)-like permease